MEYAEYCPATPHDATLQNGKGKNEKRRENVKAGGDPAEREREQEQGGEGKGKNERRENASSRASSRHLAPSEDGLRAARHGIVAAEAGRPLRLRSPLLRSVERRKERGREKKHARIIPRFKNKNVYGSLTSISRFQRLTGKTGAFGGRPWRRMRRARSPPR
jgi:hypothetical protein